MKRRFWAISLCKSLATTLMIVFVLTTFVVRPYVVVGNSMYPTLEDKDWGLANVFSAQMEGLERFDLVVINTAHKGVIVKRIIGLPNERIEVKNDQLLVNGVLVAEDFLETTYVHDIRGQGQVFTDDFGPVQLGPTDYFVMGDNRINSLDSRSNLIGLIQQKDIICKPWLRLFPLNKLGALH